MKKFNIDWNKVLNVVLALLVSVGIYMCGWVNGHISANDLLDTYERVEYVYIVEECEKEHVEDVPDVVEEDDSQNASIDVVEPVEWPKLYLDEDAVALAKSGWGEARGVKDNGVVSGKCQIAAVYWCILNRYDAGYEDSIVEVCAAPGQFAGYSPSHPVDEELLELAYDVLDRWNAEQHGETEVGRVLPAGYLWFGGDGKYNHFRNEFRTAERWDWSLADPYGA